MVSLLIKTVDPDNSSKQDVLGLSSQNMGQKIKHNMKICEYEKRYNKTKMCEGKNTDGTMNLFTYQVENILAMHNINTYALTWVPHQN